MFGEGNQYTDHQWTLGGNGVAEGPVLDSVLFNEAGMQDITLQTTILDQVLQQVQLFSTGGGGWDDFFGNPDPYFTLKDANDNVVYTSSTVDDAGSATWTGLNVVLNNPPYALDFYDEDLLDGDDWLGWAPVHAEWTRDDFRGCESERRAIDHRSRPGGDRGGCCGIGGASVA